MKSRSWVEIRHFIPFRSRFLYWDKEPYLGDCEFERRGIKVRWSRKEFRHDDYPYIGVIVSCWDKDREGVQDAMESLSDRLKRLDGGYEEFLNLWHQNILEQGQGQD